MADQQSSAGNQWVENYLDALLSKGLSSEYANKSQDADGGKHGSRELQLGRLERMEDPDQQRIFSYFMSQILQPGGEEAIRDLWNKATSTRNYGEKDARLEQFSWRIWFMKQKRERVRRENRRLESQMQLQLDDEEQVQVDLGDDIVRMPSLASDLDNRAFLKAALPVDKPGATGGSDARKPPRPGGGLGGIRKSPSAAILGQLEEFKKARETAPPKDLLDDRVDGLYVCLISLHGLVRGERMELGKDPDTGGQVKYVVELARALAKHPAVYRVDLLTRLIKDPAVDASYGEPLECILPSEGELGGAYIIRLPCGPPDVYLRKEHLWAHVREFADRGIAHCKRTLVALQQNQTPCELYAVHGHYADAGEVAAMMASTLGVDMVMTGHSLGRNKKEHLLASGTISMAEIEKTYSISRRIKAEERGLDSAMMVFTSTQQEIDEQWGLYDGYDAELAKVLRQRRRLGRYMPAMRVIPPGLDFSSLKVDLPEDPAVKEMEAKTPAYNARTFDPGSQEDLQLAASGKRGSRTPTGARSPANGGTPRGSESGEGGKPLARKDSGHREADSTPEIWKAIFKFLRHPSKPVILAMSRPDAKKNIHTLVKAFGEHPKLRQVANLVLIMGNREHIDSMASGSQKVLTQVLQLIDAYDLYGSVAYPKKHQQSDISDIYRLPLHTRGVFTNVALQEPFGLTVIEAAAHGVPTVATQNGGPVDIMKTLHSGLLVDPSNSQEVAAACFKILTNANLWDEMSANGVKNIIAYSWPSHCKRYLESMEEEKRFLRKKDHHSVVSGSWDHRKQLPSPTSAAAAGGAPPLFERVNSLRAAATAAPWPSPEPKAKDDCDLRERVSGAPKGRSPGRKHFIAVQLDGAHRMAALAPVLRQLVQATAGSEAIGVGLVSMLDFEDTATALKEAGFDGEPFDWIVCNSGADIWHALGKNGGGEAMWDADEQWDEHISHRWERAPLAKLVAKLLSREGPGMVPQSSGTMGRTLAKALGELPELRGAESKLHPHHIRIELDEQAKLSIDMGRRMKGAQKEDLSHVVMERMKRRLRQQGFRCHITLQMVPSEGELHSHLHITPVRGTRALALRFLAAKFGLDMSDFTVLAMAANVAEKQGARVIYTHTSDMVELISGVCKAFVSAPARDEAQPPSKGAADRAALERLAIPLNPKLFGDRIQFLTPDCAQLTQVVAEAQERADKAEKLPVELVDETPPNPTA